MTPLLSGVWLPPQASSMAERVDAAWNLVYWVSAFFLALITGLLLLFIVRYRARPGWRAQPSPDHNLPLELLWTLIPIGLVALMFWQGYRAYLDVATPPLNAYDVQVTGQKWNWLFTYPNGYVDGELHVPVGQPVRLTMTSPDVIHSLYLPDFRIKRDVVPGRYDKLWFTAREPGVHDVFCAEYCGTSHSKMLTKLHAHTPEEFAGWLEHASDFLARMPPAEAGGMLYNQRGCKQCHSVDGSPGTGPTFQGLFGSTQRMADGSQVRADENYIRESILEPQAKIVDGYPPVMPSFQGRIKDPEIGAIIEYLKTRASAEPKEPR
ncbi:MAG TPA: cytochrome c oxidase subunit II [Candidatus Polarisedimenticolaceae bacterium]|nr:cytochrome c oxidase subunit II [Candidatus Polarisedimenticolaceae bacterium]